MFQEEREKAEKLWQSSNSLHALENLEMKRGRGEHRTVREDAEDSLPLFGGKEVLNFMVAEVEDKGTTGNRARGLRIRIKFE